MVNRVVLGKTPEELDAERAERLRKQEAQIQTAIAERQQKIHALHIKQRSNKIILLLIVIIFTIILLVFGTYNTFFKKGLTTDDVQSSINSSISRFNYPSEGLDNFIRDNCAELFNHYITESSADLSNNNIASIDVDKNSCYIYKVRKLSNSMAQVYFAVDVITTENDSQVTDPVILEQLKRNGFGDTAMSDENSVITTSNTNADDKNIVATEETAETTEAEESTEVTEAEAGEITESTEVEETADSDIPITSLDYTTSANNEIEHYYMTGNGLVMKSGKTITYRYYCYMPIQLEYLYSDGTNDGSEGGELVSVGYKLAGEMTLAPQIETNDTNFDQITIDDTYFGFDQNLLLDDDTTSKIKIKVDKTLKDLYNYEDTSQDMHIFRQFNTYNAKYDGIDSIEAYSEPNYMGYNVYVTYKITTSQGFKFTLHTYMNVEQNGDTWIITDIL